MFNPMVVIIEAFRVAFMGQGTVTLLEVLISGALSVIIVVVGLVLFNRTERTCVDVI
jgi:lipopolysaccharide transport system permease protein